MYSTITPNIPQNALRLCQGCGMAVQHLKLENKQNAYCPRCSTQLYRGARHSFSGDIALAISALMLFIPVIIYPFLSIRLVGEVIPATVLDGVRLLNDEGYLFVAILVLLCGFLVPLLHCSCVLMANFALKTTNFPLMRWSMFGVHHLKHWMMIDVYIVSIVICCIKLRDYSDLIFGIGIPILVVLQFVCLILVMRVSPRRYWKKWDRQTQTLRQQPLNIEQGIADCPHCHLPQNTGSRCQRCNSSLTQNDSRSIQATWALIIVAALALIPANVIPISILYANGARIEDTIFSGVISLVNSDMVAIAIVIFVASIVVPVAKILGILYLLLCIHFKRTVYHRQRMMLFYIVKWIGKWSMVDIFVMAIMLTLVDRGQILNFTPGYGAVAFGVVVVFTMFAAETLDSKLIWKNYSNKNEK
ncbi:paraquat-inducible protein A [Vibrio gallicus]|uniref:paraquat-inducible protein A n=1 Tax=Vibrio gallicus TaxID=190897 RepID=UPI0021C3935A|nr:paraquat-inducible protein A [Vibrio gallicus]